MLVVMATAFQVICALAATLWICFVVAALAIGYRFMAKLRSRRRRINRLLSAVGLPIRPGRRYGVMRSRKAVRLPWPQVIARLVADVFEAPRAQPLQRRSR
jgi:hypothetical protein